MEFLQFIMLAIIVEATWESTKMVWEDDKLSIDRIGALIFGLAVSLVYRVDLILMAGISQQSTFLGFVLTGIIISRGANYVHDLLGKLNK